ncbi:hypothetical protein ACLB2K_071153 [Fragaria x ananassa]
MMTPSFVCDVYVKNSLVHFYRPKKVFDEMHVRDVVSWTGLVSGHVKAGLYGEAVELFLRMDVKPNAASFVSVVVACGRMGYLNVGKGVHGLILKHSLGMDLVVGIAVVDILWHYGRWLHEYIDRKGIKWDVHIGTALIDMYEKCGCINMALRIFSELPCGNVSTWNALLGGLAMHGHGDESLKKLEEMTRAGILDDAQKLINTMPMQLDVLILGALLSACKAKDDAELSQEILDRLLQLEWQDSGVYALLSNIFAANNRWADATRIRRLMKKRVKDRGGNGENNRHK